MPPIQEATQRHLLERWGPPKTSFTIRLDDLVIEVWKWPADSTDQCVVLYATNGPHERSGGAHHKEFVIGLQRARDDIARYLGMLWFDATREDIGHGTAVDAGGPLWPGTAMSQMLLVSQKSVIPTLFVDDQAHVEFLRVIPLYDIEAAFRHAHGEYALLRCMRDLGVDYAEPDRTQPDLSDCGVIDVSAGSSERPSREVHAPGYRRTPGRR